MRCLAIDCAQVYCSIALAEDENILLKEEREPKAAARVLLSMIDALLVETQISGKDLDFIVVTQGPGSFTGLRLACSIAQALSVVHQVPLIGVSTLQAMAQSQFIQYNYQHVVSILDAHREEIYYGAYSLNDKDLMEPVTDDGLITVANFSPPTDKKWYLVGNNHPLLKSLALSNSGYYNATHLLSLGKAAFLQGKTLSPEALIPCYLRNETAWRAV